MSSSDGAATFSELGACGASARGANPTDAEGVVGHAEPPRGEGSLPSRSSSVSSSLTLDEQARYAIRDPLETPAGEALWTARDLYGELATWPQYTVEDERYRRDSIRSARRQLAEGLGFRD